MIIRKIDAWFYGIEQRIAKWKRSRTPEYRAGQRARRRGTHVCRNPYPPFTNECSAWFEGWTAEDQRS